MIQILPAIDIINGKCVRLTKGDYNTEKVYHESPLDMAKSFEDAGASMIHIVDLDAAKANGNNFEIISAIANQTKLQVQMGGGIRNRSILQEVFDHGVNRAIIGSLAAKKPETVFEWIEEFGTEKIVIGTDVRDEYIATDGWYETSTLHVEDYIDMYRKKGGSIFLCTDIAKDGMLQGISLELYSKLLKRFEDIKLIASGGVASMADVNAARDLGMYGVITGKALYEGKITLQELFN